MFRKLFLLPICLLFAGLDNVSAGGNIAAAAPAQVRTQAQGFYRMMLGDFEITVLSDGTLPRPVDQLMSKPDKVRQVLASDHESLPLNLSINAFLINTGAQLILIDTGTGKIPGSDSSGRLLINLRAAGYRPEQIGAVLLTHMHGDHSGGLTTAGDRVFTNAVLYLDKRELAYWLDPADGKFTPEERKRIGRLSHERTDPYAAAGRLKTFDGATELFPGIRAVPAHGHTPGHTAYMVQSNDRRLLVWGDIIHCAEVQFADPTITIKYDSDPGAATATRMKLMADASRQGYLIGSAHISFPGLGHVRADPEAYSWIPLPYDATP